MRVAIIGAGPAGMSCANACLSFGLEPVVIERSEHVGGTQRGNFHPNLWMLGYPDETGREMTRRLADHFLALPLTLYQRAVVERVVRANGGFSAEIRQEGRAALLEVGALVLAIGMLPRSTTELSALAEQSPRVILGPLNDVIRDSVRESRVLILGGGDNALDHALFLAERGNHVRVCTRRAFSARKPFRDSCAANPAIELRDKCMPDAIKAEHEAVRVTWGRVTVRYDWLLVMYGYVPNVEILENFAPDIRPTLTTGGHIHVDGWQRTSVSGMYAVGDVTDNPQPSVPTAIAQGLAAAKAIERDQATGSQTT